ncbi:MAG: B12-binding domain-containing radical SAM protein [Candidatus Omnitrophica bacterium]|nr:B12-binding domain-containing radical SAM protein [Candidatus Omnitrophota bacterium]MBU1852715.1 B12-binding domain-containing radical SAM protein [Candidatus Omnitrophota bacterium]
MKVTFVHLGREHLGIEYLSSVLKKAGHEISLAYDPGLFGTEDNVFYIPFLERVFDRKNEVISRIESSTPDLVAFSVYTSNYQWTCDVARTIKEKMNVKTVFGGVHVSLVPEEVVKNDFVDFVIIGEGEYALLDLVNTLSSNRPEYSIPNVWYKKGGEVIKNPLRPPIKDLDSLPFPDKGLFENYINYRDDYMVMTARGCVFSCSYCCEAYFHKIYSDGYFRRRSASSVISELKAMKKRYNFKRVMFFDSVFFTDKKWLSGFLHEYKKEISVPFRCEGHVSFVDEDLIRLMKDSGCYGIDFGVQTFNESIRKDILHRNETNDQIDKAFSICGKLKLRYDVDLIFGLPLVKEEDYELALEFMYSHKYFNRLKCYYLAYYPKLPIVDRAIELGIIYTKDVESFEKGNVGDFFHQDSINDPHHKAWKDNFEKLYKLFPVMPSFLKRFIIKKKLYRHFHIIPGFIVIVFQLAIGLCKRDFRFIIYIKYYLSHFKKKVVNYGRI